MADITLSNGTVITEAELATIAFSVKQLIAKESKEPSQYEEVNSLSGLTTLPALLQSGSSFRLVRAAVELLKGADAKEIQLRLSDTAIQWRHDGEETWHDLITVAEIQEPAKEATDAANAAATKATEEAAKAETATTNAILAENDRKNSWVAWFENATTGVKAVWDKWFGDTKTSWNSFNSTASQAESSRKEAETARAQAETSRKEAETSRVNAENLRTKAETARKEAETARGNNEAARQQAETSRVNTEAARAQAETARQSSWVAWFENSATGVKAIWNSWFESTKNAWTNLRDAVNSTKSQCASATEECVKQSDRAKEYADNPAKVGDNGHWLVWDDSTSSYKDTGVWAYGHPQYVSFDIDTKTGELVATFETSYNGPSFKLVNGEIYVVINNQ